MFQICAGVGNLSEAIAQCQDKQVVPSSTDVGSFLCTVLSLAQSALRRFFRNLATWFVGVTDDIHSEPSSFLLWLVIRVCKPFWLKSPFCSNVVLLTHTTSLFLAFLFASLVSACKTRTSEASCRSPVAVPGWLVLQPDAIPEMSQFSWTTTTQTAFSPQHIVKYSMKKLRAVRWSASRAVITLHTPCALTMAFNAVCPFCEIDLRDTIVHNGKLRCPKCGDHVHPDAAGGGGTLHVLLLPPVSTRRGMSRPNCRGGQWCNFLPALPSRSP